MAGMIRYPADYNPILEYWAAIESGAETVGYKVRRTYKKLVYDIEHPGEYFYSNKRANHIIEFAENYCRHSKGTPPGRRPSWRRFSGLWISRATGSTGKLC